MRQQGKFKFLPDIALADVAFEAYGKSLGELFENAAAALLDVSVNPKSLSTKPSQTRRVEFVDTKPENLLYDFLSELIYLKDAEGFLASKAEVRMIERDKGWRLEAEIKGERIDAGKHALRVDVKAVTKHMFGIQKTRQGYSARIVLDI